MLQMLLQLPYVPLRRASLALNLRGFDMLVKTAHPAYPCHISCSALRHSASTVLPLCIIGIPRY